MLTINEYYKPFDDSIAELNLILGKVYLKIANQDENDIALNNFDYNSFIKQIEDTITLLKMKRCRYKFEKMSEAEFEQYLRTDSQGNLTITKEHKIRFYDTLQSISKLYNVPILTILDYNDIVKQDFEDLKEQEGTILVPVVIHARERTVYENLSVFDSHSGKSAWGRDISNSLDVEGGKLKILDNEQTLVQNLSSILGDYGSIPFYEELTLNADWGSDYPKSFLELYTKVKIERRFELEPRVQQVIDVQSQQVESGLLFDVRLYPINVDILPENELNLLAG